MVLGTVVLLAILLLWYMLRRIHFYSTNAPLPPARKEIDPEIVEWPAELFDAELTPADKNIVLRAAPEEVDGGFDWSATDEDQYSRIIIQNMYVSDYRNSQRRPSAADSVLDLHDVYSVAV